MRMLVRDKTDWNATSRLNFRRVYILIFAGVARAKMQRAVIGMMLPFVAAQGWPTSTMNGGIAVVQTPMTTAAPTAYHEILRRQDATSLCGYVHGNGCRFGCSWQLESTDAENVGSITIDLCGRRHLRLEHRLFSIWLLYGDSWGVSPWLQPRDQVLRLV